MKRVIKSPLMYVQGTQVLEQLYDFAANVGSKGMYGIVGPSALKKYEKQILQSFSGDKKISVKLEKFCGECCDEEITRIVKEIKQSNVDIVLGMGGGKALDTAKAVGFYANLPVIIMPTAASSDAPCSALSVIYTKEGAFKYYLFLKSNPSIVAVDTDIVANAPVRLLVAGMGDALATFFEARACYKSGAVAISGGKCSQTAMAIASACLESLYKNGSVAKNCAEKNTVCEALENIVEANTYLSGLGFESGGLAAAHAIHNGLTILEETHSLLHGEKVAFGTLVQLALEKAPQEEISKVVAFCKEVGLPTTLSGIGLKNPKEEDIMNVAKASCAETETMKNMPFPVTAEDVYSAIFRADKLGSTL